jgi:magnesium-transporting ATPase (P-type)
VGKIWEMLAKEQEETPLQEKLNKLAKHIGYFGLISAIIVVITLWIR